MLRSSGAVVRTLLRLAAAVVLGALPAAAQDHLLLTEFAATPTDAEFIEIYNPTADIVDLSNYYLCDQVYQPDPLSNYWHIVDGALLPFDFEFAARFPAGASIAPGQTIVISMVDAALFTAAWSTGGSVVVPDYEMLDDGMADGIPGMFDPGPELIGQPYIDDEAGLSNNRDTIILFYWDGESDLVQDVDMVQWSNSGPEFVTVSPNKTGDAVDGPDPDNVATPYLPDTPAQGQDLAAAGPNTAGLTISRIDFAEGTETSSGGNGITGHDETSENLSVTWAADTPQSIGSPGEYGPPALLSAVALEEDRVRLGFSRVLDAVSAAKASHYFLLEIGTPAGGITSVPFTVESAALAADGLTVELETARLVPGALYELRASGVLTQDLSLSLVPGSRAFFRGYQPGPGLALTVPRRPYVPHIDPPLEIAYSAPQGEHVLLRVFDVQGRELFVLADETAPPGGLRTFLWDGRDDLNQRLPAGVYVLHLEIPGRGDETTAPVVVAAAGEGTLR